MEISNQLIVVAECILFGFFSILQCSFLNKNPSDHVGHLYLINETRKSGWKLPDRPSMILNKSTWGGYPLFTHYIIGKFPEESYKLISLTIKTTILLITSFLVVRYFSIEPQLVSYVFFLLLFSPYNFDVSNSANFGLSSRTIGQLLLILTILSLSNYSTLEQGIDNRYIFLSIILCLAVIGFNVFATQALLIFSFASIFFGNILPSIVLVSSIIIFALIFGRYGRRYIFSTVKYWHYYRIKFAEVSILKDYPSFWLTPFRELSKLLSNKDWKNIFNLIYKNSLLNALFLNPVFWVGLYFIYESNNHSSIYFQFIIAMLIAFFITSFRQARFWGEPNRYLEIATPILIILTIDDLIQLDFFFTPYLIILLIMHLIVSKFLSDRLINNSDSLDKFSQCIELTVKAPVLASNNNHSLKHFLPNGWQYVTIWNIEEGISNIESTEAFSPFPFINFGAFLKIIDDYKPNVLIIDQRKDTITNEISNRGFVEVMSADNYLLFIKN